MKFDNIIPTVTSQVVTFAAEVNLENLYKTLPLNENVTGIWYQNRFRGKILWMKGECLWILFRGTTYISIYPNCLRLPFGKKDFFDFWEELGQHFLPPIKAIRGNKYHLKYKIDPPWDGKRHHLQTLSSSFSWIENGYVFQRSNSLQEAKADFLEFIDLVE